MSTSLISLLALAWATAAGAASPAAEALLEVRKLDPERAISHPSPPVRIRFVRDAAGVVACGTDAVPLHDLPKGLVDFDQPFPRGKVGAGCASKASWTRKPSRAPTIEACLDPSPRAPLKLLIERCLTI